MPARRQPLHPSEGAEMPISVLEIWNREERLWIALRPVSQDNFPPCIKRILQTANAGRHRTAAILAAFLGQAGWSRDEAKKLWTKAAGVEDRIFEEWFLKMHCPKCETLKRESEGYPDLGIGDLGICQPDEECLEFQGPVEYAAGVKTEEDRSKGWQEHIKILHIARVLDWTSGKEGEIELSQPEMNELLSLLNNLTEDKILVYARTRIRGRLRPHFFLKDEAGPRKRILSEYL